MMIPDTGSKGSDDDERSALRCGPQTRGPYHTARIAESSGSVRTSRNTDAAVAARSVSAARQRPALSMAEAEAWEYPLSVEAALQLCCGDSASRRGGGGGGGGASGAITDQDRRAPPVDAPETPVYACGVRGWAGVALGLAWASHGAHLVLFSVLGPSVACVLDLTPFHTGVVMATALSAAALGCLTWGVIADATSMGRRAALLSAVAIGGLGDACAALAPSYLPFLTCVFLSGFGAGGGAPLALSLAREVIGKASRSSLMVQMAMWHALGSVAEALLAWLLLPVDAHAWRTLSGLTAIPALVILALSRFMPRSPHFWCASGDMATALASLSFIAAAHGKVVPTFATLEVPEGADVQREEVPELSLGGTPSKDRSRSGRRRRDAHPSGLQGAFSRHVRRILVRMILLWSFVAAAYFLHAMAAAQVFTPGRVDIGCGLVDSLDESTAQHEEAAASEWDGCNELTSSVIGDNAGLAVAELVGVVVLALFGRRGGSLGGRFQCACFAAAGVSSLVLATCLGREFDLLLLVFARAVGAAGTQAAWFYLVEAFPTTSRGAGVGMVIAVAGLLAAFTVPLGQPLLGPSSTSPFFVSIFPFAFLFGKAALSTPAATAVSMEARNRTADGSGLCATVPQLQRITLEVEADSANGRSSISESGTTSTHLPQRRAGFWKSVLPGRQANPQGEYGPVGAQSDESGDGDSLIGRAEAGSQDRRDSLDSPRSYTGRLDSEESGVGVGVSAAMVSHPTLDAVRLELKQAGPVPNPELVAALADRLEHASSAADASKRQADAMAEEASRLRLLLRHVEVHTPKRPISAFR